MYKRLRNLIIIAVVLIAIAAVIRLTSTSQPARAASGAPQEVSVVDRGDIAQTVSATGSLQTNQSASLSFPVSGRVASINVNEGDHVVKGQTIATLNNQSYVDASQQAQVKVVSQQIALRALTEKPRQVDIDVAQANLNAAKVSLQSAQGGSDKTQTQINALNVEKAKNQLWQTELQRDANNNKKNDLLSNPRTAPQANSLPSDVSQNGNITAGSYDVQIAQSQLAAAQAQGASVSGIASAEAKVTAAQVALDNLIKGGDPNDVARANAQLQAAQAALDLAQTNLAKTVLVAPFDGVVAKLNIKGGEMTPSGAAAAMIDTSSFYVDVPVDEADVSRIAAEQSVILTFDALPGTTVKGKVIRVSQAATKSGDVVTYPVRIQIDPAGNPLLSSMSATATITTSQATGVVRVRSRFIRLDRATNKAYVQVRQPDGSFKDVEVTLGTRNDTFTEIKQGLKVGDVVTLAAASGQNQTGGQGGPGGPGLGGMLR